MHYHRIVFCFVFTDAIRLYYICVNFDLLKSDIPSHTDLLFLSNICKIRDIFSFSCIHHSKKTFQLIVFLTVKVVSKHIAHFDPIEFEASRLSRLFILFSTTILCCASIMFSFSIE